MMRPKSVNQDIPLMRWYSKEQMTKAVYRRVGEMVRPTK